MRKPVLTAALVGVVLAGCGTTLPVQSSGSGNELGGVVQPSGVPDQAGTTGGAQLGGPTTTGGISSSATGGGEQAGSAGGLPSVSSTVGPVTRGALPPVEIGTYYLNGGNAALAAAGFAGLVIPDSKPVFDAFVQDINKHGGLAGRQIKPVYFEYNEGADPVAQDQAACSAFTQDHHVFLVVGGINSGAGQLLPCLAQHDVPLISAAAGGDEQFFAQYHRYEYEPQQLNFTAGLALLVGNLKARGYLTGVKKVGVVQYPGAAYDRAVDNGLAPALKRVGLSITERVHTGSATDNASIASASASAELKFSAEHIDLVVFMAPGGAAQTDFMNTAQQQGYKPKYGIWSADSPGIMATTAPAAQLAGTMGVGWLPGLDVATAQDPTATTPAGKACLAKGKAMGLDESGLANPLVRAACDTFASLLGAIAGNVEATRSTAVLEAGFDALGARIASASAFRVDWVPGHHDGAAGYRDLVWDSSCGTGCFAYVGPTKMITR